MKSIKNDLQALMCAGAVAALTIGCDRTVSKSESETIKRDGTVEKTEKSVTESSDGTIKKEEKSSTERP